MNYLSIRLPLGRDAEPLLVVPREGARPELACQPRELTTAMVRAVRYALQALPLGYDSSGRVIVGVPIDLWLLAQATVVDVAAGPDSVMEAVARAVPGAVFEVEAADSRAGDLALEVLTLRREARAAHDARFAERARTAERLAALGAVEAAMRYEPRPGPIEEIARRVEEHLAVEQRARDALEREYSETELRRLHELLGSILRLGDACCDEGAQAAAFIDAALAGGGDAG